MLADVQEVALQLPSDWSDAVGALRAFRHAFQAQVGVAPCVLVLGRDRAVDGAVLPAEPAAEAQDLPALVSYVGVLGAQQALLSTGGRLRDHILELVAGPSPSVRIVPDGPSAEALPDPAVERLLLHFAREPLPVQQRPMVLDHLAELGFRLLLR